MFEIMMKGNQEFIVVRRMPGSKPGAIPFERRDFGIRGVGPWGNPADFIDIVKKARGSGMLIDGVAFIDPIDNPEEPIYKVI